MRISLPCLLVALLSTAGLIGQTTPSAAPDLQKRVEEIAALHHGKVALYAEDLATHQTVSLDPDKPVQTASVIKLAILYEALEQIRAGKVHFEDSITVTRVDQVPGSGVLLLLDAPLHVTFKDVLNLMIMMSDNSAANLAMDHLGIANINDRMAKLGLTDTYLYKKVFTPVAAGVTLPPDFKRFGLGKTTARQMATLMTKFVECRLADPSQPPQATDQALCANALKMLHVQFYRSAIPRFLDGTPGATGDSIANKTGSLDAVRNDVAAISTKSGIVVISAFTYENASHAWVADQEGELTIAKLAKAIVTAWSPSGLAAWPVAAVPDPPR